MINILGIKLPFKPSWLDPIAKTILKVCDIPSSVKIKVKFTQNRPRTHREGVAQLYSFFNIGTIWGWVVNAKPRSLYPRERAGTHCTAGWVGPRPAWISAENLAPHRNSISGLSSQQYVTTPRTLSRPTYHHHYSTVMPVVFVEKNNCRRTEYIMVTINH